jgi:hypothetical protein
MAIQYKSKDDHSFHWGYELNPFDVNKIEHIMFLLNPQQKRPLSIAWSNVQAKLDRLPKPPIDIAADYISALCKQSMAVIDRALPAEFLSMLQKKFVFTIPAVFSDETKDSIIRVCILL